MNFAEKLQKRLLEVASAATVTKPLDSFSEFDGLTEPAEVQTLRESICGSCEYHADQKCTSCGCYIQVIIKTKRFECPQYKW